MENKKPEDTIEENQPEETTDNLKKFSDLNEDDNAKSKVISKDGKDISDLVNMSHLRAEDQTWD